MCPGAGTTGDSDREVVRAPLISGGEVAAISPSRHRVAPLSPPAGRDSPLTLGPRHGDKEKIDINTDAQLSIDEIDFWRLINVVLVQLILMLLLGTGVMLPLVIPLSGLPVPSALTLLSSYSCPESSQTDAMLSMMYDVFTAMLHFVSNVCLFRYDLQCQMPKEHKDVLRLQIILFVWSTYLSQKCVKR